MLELPSRGNLGPADKVDALRAQPDQTYTFIVRYAEGVEVEPEGLGLGPATTEIRKLEIINGFAAPLEVSRAFGLAEQAAIEQVWYLHPDLAALYVNAIAALEYNLKTIPLPGVANLSIGPPVRFWEEVPDLSAPIHAATRAAADGGLIPVVAIGNSGQGGKSAEGWINPWCAPEWVICVGAFDGTSGTVADFSSRGDPARPGSWPDVVADGVDVVGPYPSGKKKSSQRKHRDESNPGFRQLVPPEKWDLYTLESGTSQAAAITSSALAQVLHFLRELLRQRAPAADGAPVFSLTAEPDRITRYDRSRPRLTGNAISQPDGGVVYEYWLDEPWKMAKQLLVDSALPLAGAQPHAVGAGLVDLAYIRAQFGQFGVVEPKFFPTKVTEG